MSDDKGWTMLAGEDADAMVDRYIASRRSQCTRPLHTKLGAENDHLRLSLLTMAARERETAAERDALRTMLAEAREHRDNVSRAIGHVGRGYDGDVRAVWCALGNGDDPPEDIDDVTDAIHDLRTECHRLRGLADAARERSDVLIARSEDRASRITALMLRVAARRDQLTSELSIVTGERDRLQARLAGSTVPPTVEDLIAYDGAWMVLLPDAEHPDVMVIRASPEGVVTVRFSDGDAMELRRWKEGMAEADGTRWWPIGRDGLIAERSTEGMR